MSTLTRDEVVQWAHWLISNHPVLTKQITNMRDLALRALEQTNAAEQEISGGKPEASDTARHQPAPAAPHSEPQAVVAGDSKPRVEIAIDSKTPARSEPCNRYVPSAALWSDRCVCGFTLSLHA